MAEEEYREQKARLDFLLQQKKDLSESIAQTKEAILKIDEESRHPFFDRRWTKSTEFSRTCSSPCSRAERPRSG